ncbi:MAG TPA: ATP-binding protein [Gemmatimonadaceae bacterium]|nr:ATP-binding protein [Gemmatimonadaceae bacterium]
MPSRRLSLRTELLFTLGILAAAALAIGVSSVIVLYGALDPSHAAAYISFLVAADVCVLVGFVAYQVERVVLRPVRETAATAEAIAAGDLARRVTPGESWEMANLADSVNRMTERLLEERSHLVRVEKMASVGRLAAGIAHEVGNPLGAINGYIHLLRTGAPQSNDALAGLEREVDRIDRIVRGLLDYARSKPGSQGQVDLNAVARSVVELLGMQGILKTVQLEMRVASEPLVVAGDRTDLEQAFVNLLLNAVDAMGAQGSLSIILRQTDRTEMLHGARRYSDGVARPLNPPSARAMRWMENTKAEAFAMVAITDSGPGIPPEDVERVFEPFYTTKEPGKGTGLGLAIVARAVENSAGTIWVSRSREGGAAFRMLFPLRGTLRKSEPVRARPSVPVVAST